MSKTYYLPTDDAGKLAWLTNLGAKLPGYKTILNLTDADISGVQADNTFFAFVLNSNNQVAAYAKQWTTYKNTARSGGDASLAILPVAPVFTSPAVTVEPDIFGRATALVARIRVATGYTQAIGQALRIIGADNPVDPSTLKPVLDVEVDAGQVNVGWTKQSADGIEIWVDRGDGKGFIFLAIDTIPDYTDTQPLPATAAVWKYKAIYIIADERVGSWSDVVSLPVAA